MSKLKAPTHAITGVFVFLLLGVFAVFSTVMVLLGANAYRGAVERTGMHNAARISTSYVRSMLRADDEAGVISVEEVPGVVQAEDNSETPASVNAIVLRNIYGDEAYITCIYIWDGMLREWFASEDMPFYVNGGEAVCEAEELQATLEGQLLRVRILAGGDWSEVSVALRAQVR